MRYGTFAFVTVSLAVFLLFAPAIGNAVFTGLFIGGNMGTAMFYAPNQNDPPSQLLALTMGLLANYKTAPWAPMTETALGWIGQVVGVVFVAAFFAAMYTLYAGVSQLLFYGKVAPKMRRTYLMRTFLFGFVLSASTLAYGWMNFAAAFWKSPDTTLAIIPLVIFAVIMWRQHKLNVRVGAPLA